MPNKIIILCESEEESDYFINNLQNDFQIEAFLHFEDAQNVLTDPDVMIVIANCESARVQGLSLLKNAAKIAPSVIRIGFSYQENLDIAAAAVNEASVFRYLFGKPDPAHLKQIITEGFQVKTLEHNLTELLNTIEQNPEQYDEELIKLAKKLTGSK